MSGADYFLLFLFLLVSGFPFLWLVADALLTGALRRWRWDARRKFLVVNAALYPFVFLLLLATSERVFGVGAEMAAYLEPIVEASEAAVREGAPPERNNPMLAFLLFTALFGSALLVYTAGMGFLYFLGSTCAYGRSGFTGLWQAPALGLGVALAGVAVTYFLRTPIFNWLEL